MALLKEITLYNGDVVRYHRIGEYKFDGPICTAVLYSFRSHDHRALPVTPLDKREFPFALQPNQAFETQAYAAIKSLPEWADAQDV